MSPAQLEQTTLIIVNREALGEARHRSPAQPHLRIQDVGDSNTVRRFYGLVYGKQRRSRGGERVDIAVTERG